MWEAIRDVTLSSNAIIVIGFLIFILLIGVALSKTGLLSIHTEAVSVGAADRERNIMRQQIEWARMHFEAMEHSMKKPDNYDTWRGRFIAERVFDEYVEWITFNHFSKSPAYIEIKQDKIVALVRGMTVHDFFHTEEFENFLREDTRRCILQLIKIREVYK